MADKGLSLKSMLFISVILILVVGIVFVGRSMTSNVIFSYETLDEQSLEFKKEKAINNGIQWILDNPTSFEVSNGGFIEMGEEINLFYILYLNSDNVEKKAFYEDKIIETVDKLNSNWFFHMQRASEITPYLLTTKIAERVGYDTTKFHKFIQEEIISLNDQSRPITYVLLDEALLYDLGYASKESLEKIKEQAVIATLIKNPELNPLNQKDIPDNLMENFFYDVIHEVFAASSLGEHDPKWLLSEEEVEFVEDVVEEGFLRYLSGKEVDLLGELVVCAKIMGHVDFPEFEKAIEIIVDAQEEDGSFGEVQRMKNLGRKSFYRHGVLVSVWALAS